MDGGINMQSDSSCSNLLIPRLVLLLAVKEKFSSSKLVMDVLSFQAALEKTREQMVRGVGSLSGFSRDGEVSKMVKDSLAVMPTRPDQLAEAEKKCMVYWKMLADQAPHSVDDSNPTAVAAAVVVFSQAVDRHLLPFLHASALAPLLKGTLPGPQQAWSEFLVPTFSRDEQLAPIVGLVRHAQNGGFMPTSQPLPRQRQLLTLAFLIIKQLISLVTQAGKAQQDGRSTHSMQPPTSTKTDLVFYATDRSDIAVQSPRRSEASSIGSLDELSYGMVEVKIPVQPERPGPVERPTPDNEVVITLRTSLRHDYKLFIEKTNTHLNSKPGAASMPGVLVYVHGAMTDFDDSLKRAAQLKHDLRLSGAAISYSWTSKGSSCIHYLKQYLSDENSVERTVPYLANFIKLCITQVKGDKLHLVAHSMGNRALIGALQKLLTESASECIGKGMPLRNVLLAAADAGLGRLQDMFKKAKAVYGQYVTEKQKTIHFSVYCAVDDVALLVSQTVFPWHWGKPRVGLTLTHFGEDAITLAEDPETGYLDVIDATAAEAGIVLNHGYYHSVPTVLLDIQRLLSTASKHRAFFRLPTPSEKWPTIYKERAFYSFWPRFWQYYWASHN